MQTTSNLGLRKPGENDFIDIEDLNYNAEKLDEKVQAVIEGIEAFAGLKGSIQLITDDEFVNSLINNTAKPGSVLLFSNIGERNGNVTDESYTLYAGLMNCNRYSNCDITVKAIHMEEQSLHPMFFQSPNFFIAKVDKQNAKKVVIYPLGGGNVEELRERLDSVEEKANQAFTQAGEGKAKIVDAFTGLGISANSNETFKSLADKIKNKALSREKIANALTNKGVPTSTTATQEKIVENINNGFADKIFNIFKAPMYAFQSYGGGDYEKTRASWYASGNREEYILKDGLKTKTAVKINWGSCDFIAFELGRMDISKYKYIAIPAFGSQNTGKLNFLSCSSIFKKNRVTKQEFEDANAVRIHYGSGSLNTFYYVKRHGKDAVHVFDTYYHQFIAVPTMQYPVGDWFLVISRPSSENEVKGTIVFYSKEDIG